MSENTTQPTEIDRDVLAELVAAGDRHVTTTDFVHRDG